MKGQPLSTPQRNVFTLKKLYSNTAITNCGAVYSLKGYPFDSALWAQAINIYLATNDAQRIRINDGIKPTQDIADFKPEMFEGFVDLSNVSDSDRQELYKTWVKQKFTDKQYKFKILKFSETESGIFSVKDHIITDATTEALMFEQIINTYISLQKGIRDDLEAPRPSYFSLLEREEGYFLGPKYKSDQKYWEAKFGEEPVVVSLANQQVEDLNADHYSRVLDADLTKRIKEFAEINSLSPAVIFEALVCAYLKIVTNESKIPIGSPYLGRARSQMQTSGMFINTIPLLVDVPDGLNFEELCDAIHHEKMDAGRHQKYPFSDIQRDLREKFGFTGKLFDVVVSYQPAQIEIYDDGKKVDCSSEWIPSGNANSGLIIHLNDRGNTGRYEITTEYQTAAFSYSAVESIVDRLILILNQVLNNKNIALKDIDVLCEQDKVNYGEFNGSEKKPITKNLIELLEEQVRLNPNVRALISGKEPPLTYAQLNRLANSLGHTIQNYNLPRGEVIPIVGERSYLTIIALLAITKAGYSYCLLDTKTYPKDRIDSLIETCGSKLILKHGDCSYTKAGVKTVDISGQSAWSQNYENLDTEIDLNDPFVILHTSGTTGGTPKAVKISHEAVVNMATNNPYLMENCDYGLSLITMTFDAFTMEVLMPLLSGKTLVLSTPEEQKSNSMIKRLVAKYPNSFVALNPKRLKEYLSDPDDSCWKNIRSIATGGENLGPELVDLVKRKTNARIHFQFGLTETTVFNCSKEILDHNVTIGKPVTNFEIIIVNKNHQLLPPGTIGEIVIVGPGVAHGYLGDEEKTKASFLTINGSRAYKTGDLGYINENNELVYCGRKDSQLKINGVRFEAREIESLMNLFEGIKHSVVTVKKHNNSSYVIAYYETDSFVDEERLTEYLEKKLQNSVVPSVFINMDKLPTTRTGKLLRDKLPDVDFETYFAQQNAKLYEAPNNETQKLLVEIWEKVLKKENIGIKIKWEKVGGGSLDAQDMLDIIFEKFGIRINYDDLPTSPTVEFLDKIINGEIKLEKNGIPDHNDLDDIIFSQEPNLNSGVLLTGATGYCGSHLFYTLLKNTDRDVYCLVRNFDNFYEKMSYYFANEELVQYKNRIHLIKGDIAENNLGIAPSYYELLKSEIGIVIHSAAKVEHSGPIDEYRKANYDGLRNVAKFTAEINGVLHSVSTTSVSGQGLCGQTREDIVFTENDLDVGQNYKDNNYVWSKFRGEQLIHDFQARGLKASIYRLGSISNRSDGLFQQNADNSGFKLLVELIKELGILPVELEGQEVNIAAVDDMAKAITTLAFQIPDNRTYHIYDSRIKNLKDYLLINNINYEQVDMSTFAEQARAFIIAHPKYRIVGQYLSVKPSTITINNDQTEHILRELGFTYQSPQGGAKNHGGGILHLHPGNADS